MWFDRLALSHSSAPPQEARPKSPLPRRSGSNVGPYITSQRSVPASKGPTPTPTPGSLLATLRRVNSGTLRQLTSNTNSANSLDVLDKLLRTSASQTTLHSVTDDDLARDFDFGGLSLRDLALEDEALPSRRDGIGVMANREPEDFEKEKAQYEDLHKSIRVCDEILSSVEANLTNFRNDLAAVSADIESLQSRSTTINVRLENRAAVEKGLSPVIEKMSVSPLVVHKITEGNIDDAWVRTVADLDKRATAQRKNSSSMGQQGRALKDLGPLLDKLILKAIARIRDFFVAQIRALRSPQINAQVIQQQQFLRYKELYSFLYKHHETLGHELCQAYVNTMRWYYADQFSKYEKALEKIKLHIVDRNDLLAHDESVRKTSVLMGPARPTGVPHDAFSLGRRVDLLKGNNTLALPSHLAEEENGTHYLEMPFRNFNLALIDNCAFEFTFMASFFGPSMPLANISRHFNYMFEPTFGLGEALTRRLAADTFDALGLLLAIRLNQHFAFELQRRRVPAADSYVFGTNMLLWPRLQVVMSAHCDSVRAATAALPTKPSAAAAKTMNTAPHVITQRFGNLLRGILVLSRENGDDEPIVTSLSRLRGEVEAFLKKYSAGFGSDQRRKDRLLYNNYSLILTIITDTSGKLANEQVEHFESLKMTVQEKGLERAT